MLGFEQFLISIKLNLIVSTTNFFVALAVYLI